MSCDSQHGRGICDSDGLLVGNGIRSGMFHTALVNSLYRLLCARLHARIHHNYTLCIAVSHLTTIVEPGAIGVHVEKSGVSF